MKNDFEEGSGGRSRHVAANAHTHLSLIGLGHVLINPPCPLNPRLCCKSRKFQGHESLAKTRSGEQSPIRTDAIALSKSPVSLTLGDEAPHILTRKTRLQPLEFLIISAKRLLQHNPPKSDSTADIELGRLRAINRHHPSNRQRDVFGLIFAMISVDQGDRSFGSKSKARLCPRIAFPPTSIRRGSIGGKLWGRLPAD